MVGANAVGKFLPVGRRRQASRVDTERGGTLADPLFVGRDEIIERCRIALIDAGELRQERLRAVERMQRIALRIKLLWRQILMISKKFAMRVEDLAEFRLRYWHRPRWRAVIGDDVEHDFQSALA